MKNIFYCLTLLLCTSAIAEENALKIATDCIIKKTTPNERFSAFKLTIYEANLVNQGTDINKIEALHTERADLMTKMAYRCLDELKALPMGNTKGVGAAVMREITLEIANNPKVQELYK